MKPIDMYYAFKPAIPRSAQISMRRLVAARKRRKNRNVWPIDPKAGKSPGGWMGWPENKRFAFVLQHDVDSGEGLNRCMQLMDLEKHLGFRSSFNFVPEGYYLPVEIRRKLADSGFEVGVHGLRHDGKTFRDQAAFLRRAPIIDHYLNEWGVFGFTSPSMLRNLCLMAELDIEHGCSTFDTDPFEPQSDGVGTIFPFYARNTSGTRTYVELPYTLPQDHCLYVILREKDIGIWKYKLDWIVANGGMAMLNSHPDYMNFSSSKCSREEYPVAFYVEFLEYIKNKYPDQYWHPLPREIAQFWRNTRPFKDDHTTQGSRKAVFPNLNKGNQSSQNKPASAAKIWIDLDNTPHVPFFLPIIHELERRGYKIVLTAREAFQVCELAEAAGLPITKIGHHYGKNPIMKVIGLFRRSAQLFSFYRRNRPDIAISHGARSQILLSNLLGIPTILIADYEHSRTIPLPIARPRWLIVPEALPVKELLLKFHRIRQYPGIKEDVYVPTFEPNPTILRELGIGGEEIMITVRPPADEAHYYNPESDVLLFELMSRIVKTPGVRAVLLPRNHHQERFLRTNHPDWFTDSKTIVPSRAIDGLNLLWHSDLVVSGGGTMNREAAALGVPVYSIFRGKTGAVDRMLELEGRLTMLRNSEEIWTRIHFERRIKDLLPDGQPRAALTKILYHIENIIEIERVKRQKSRTLGHTDCHVNNVGSRE
jgi:predicted glycosyltransferase